MINVNYFLLYSNPTPGVIINHPEGKNVYEGIKIDYRREVSIIVFTKYFKQSGYYTGTVIPLHTQVFFKYCSYYSICIRDIESDK